MTILLVPGDTVLAFPGTGSLLPTAASLIPGDEVTMLAGSPVTGCATIAATLTEGDTTLVTFTDGSVLAVASNAPADLTPPF